MVRKRIPPFLFVRLAPLPAPWADEKDVSFGDYYSGMENVLRGNPTANLSRTVVEPANDRTI
jgi:hypothetical protein